MSILKPKSNHKIVTIVTIQNKIIPSSDFSHCKISYLLVLILFSVLQSHAQQPTQSDINHNKQILQEFIQYNPDFVQMKAQRIARIRTLLAKVNENEAAGYKTNCSHQILWEIKALIMQTADFRLIDNRLADLDSSLAHPEKEALALLQDSVNGSWGICFDEWFCKLDAFCDEIGKDENKHSSKFQPHFLDQVNSPEKLTNYLESISVSDIPKTGTDHLLEFNLSLTDLLRLILRDRPKGYNWDPGLKKTLTDLIFKHFRNPETGWWGESYVRDGRVQFVDDLSTTFHIVTYLRGNVPDLPLIVSTTLAVKDLDFPVGWLYKGAYWNHNNMDVVALFKAGWPYADVNQKKAMTTEIQKLLQWCLNESLQPDGSFKPHVADGSLEEGVYYGTSFLGRIGFFDKAERFWTDKDFPESEAIRNKIIDYIHKHSSSGGSGGSYYESALEDYLNYKPDKENHN
jgi:hypothetical protein